MKVTRINLIPEKYRLEPSIEDWKNIGDLPESISELLAELGRVYVPALLANEKAVLNGDKTWESEIDGKLWKQMTFVYQAKCLTWIREEFGKLDHEQKSKVLQLLEGSGCEVLIN